MARTWKVLMALSVWHLLDHGLLICAFSLNLKYHVTNAPSGVSFVSGLSTSVVHAFSNVHCGTKCIRHECVGFSYQGNMCYLEGVGSEKGLPVVGPQIFRHWTVNRAFLRPVYAVHGHYPGSPPENAVDDQTCLTWTTTSQGCCYGTYSTDNIWLVIDLGASMRVHVVGVGTQRMLDTEVRVGQQLLQTGDFSSYELLGRCSTVTVEGWMKFSKQSGIVGRYVSIQHIPNANFYVCDVVVLADD